MTDRVPTIRLFLVVFAIATISLICPARSGAQGLDVSGGYTHGTGNFGLDGFHLGTSWFFAPRVALAGEYDGVWDTSRVGTFDFTSVGAIASRTHLQDFLVGPRFYFPVYTINDTSNNNRTRNRNRKIYRLYPFGEAQFGVSHIHEEIQEGINPALTNSDSAFSWMLGGGVDYPLADHWMARGTLGLLRTHFNSEAQSRLRLGLGIVYTFGER